MDFYINQEYLTDIITREIFAPRGNIETITHDQLIDVIKNIGKTYVTGSKDHPEFAALRDRLENEGYIKTERQWWNGDRVLKPFRLNDVEFEKDDQFPCGAAMRGHLNFSRKYSRRNQNEKSD